MKSGILAFIGLPASKWLKLDANKAITSGDPGISDVTGLTDALAGKAAASHASQHNAGGGAGATGVAVGNPATANSGGGGGGSGAGDYLAGGNGGSGIVIVRYVV